MGRYYFFQKSNLFDFVIVVGTDIGIVMNIFFSNGKGIRGIISVFRVVRITRVFRFIKEKKIVRVLLDTLVFVLPSISNVVTLVFLIYFIYACLGMNLFGTIMFRENIN